MQFGDSESASSIIKSLQLSSRGAGPSGHITLGSSRALPPLHPQSPPQPSKPDSDPNGSKVLLQSPRKPRAPALAPPPLANKHRGNTRSFPQHHRILQRRRDLYQTKAALVSPQPGKGEERRSQGFNSNHTFSRCFTTRDAENALETIPPSHCLPTPCGSPGSGPGVPAHPADGHGLCRSHGCPIPPPAPTQRCCGPAPWLAPALNESDPHVQGVARMPHEQGSGWGGMCIPPASLGL